MHHSRPDWAALILRLGLAAIFLFHGSLKFVFGFTSWEPSLPEPVQAAVAWVEIICGVCFLLGLFSRYAGIAVIVIMASAIWLVSGQSDVVRIEQTARTGVDDAGALYRGMNRISPGYEYNVALLVMAAALVMLGSGPFALDRFIVAEIRRRREKRIGSTAPTTSVSSTPAPVSGSP